MCNFLLHNFFLENAKTWVGQTTINGRKRGIALGGKKNYATSTNEDLGQTSNWSKLVAVYLPVARLTILDRLVTCYLPAGRSASSKKSVTEVLNVSDVSFFTDLSRVSKYRILIYFPLSLKTKRDEITEALP